MLLSYLCEVAPLSSAFLIFSWHNRLAILEQSIRHRAWCRLCITADNMSDYLFLRGRTRTDQPDFTCEHRLTPRARPQYASRWPCLLRPVPLAARHQWCGTGECAACARCRWHQHRAPRTAAGSGMSRLHRTTGSLVESFAELFGNLRSSKRYMHPRGAHAKAPRNCPRAALS